jgi:hypothetical protein
MKFYFFLFFLLTSLGLSNELIAQEESLKFGLVAEYGLLEPKVDAYVSDKYHIYSTGSTSDGFRLGGFAQLKVKKGFWNFELSYFENGSFFQFINLKPEEEIAAYGWVELIGSGAYSNDMVQLSISRGIFISKHFTLEGGFVGSLQLKDKYLTGKPDSYFDNTPFTGNKIVFRFADGFNRFLVSGNVRASYIFGPLTAYLSIEKSITSVSKGVEYKGHMHPLHYGIRIWSLGLKYTILSIKK